jgi:hypothetical protein
VSGALSNRAECALPQPNRLRISDISSGNFVPRMPIRIKISPK